ncbi:MAG: hypothetical protein LQ342_008074 [Letrouitia transgressa]|nr:MAG: hypothetical protein LQ342_008074 [Letrouitia transgressa]
MRRNGNTNTNRTYNPRNTKPAIPLDVDEVDAALERFIRQKYDQQVFSGARAAAPAARHDTGSTRSSDDQPPPLPPKPNKRFGFGFRSASAGNALQAESLPPPIQVNKQSRIFGASVGGNGENMDAKLATLRDMGFTDEKRNTSVLKGLNGNMERAIESLVRLGEGSGPVSRPRSPPKPRQAAVNQASLVQPFASVGVEPPSAPNGQSNSEVETPAASTPMSSEPRSFSPSNPFQQPQPYNPFDSHSATWPLEKAFEGMQVSQPLFPNATGGYPIQPPHIQDVRFQQSMTPPVPQQPHQSFHNPYPQSIPENSYNPFIQPAQPALTTTVNPYLNSNPFTPIHTLQQTQLPPQQPPLPNQSPFTAPQLPFAHSQQQNPWQTAPQPQFSDPYQPQPLQPLQPQQAGRVDKSSILALYNYPQLAPPPLSEISAHVDASSGPSSAETAAKNAASEAPKPLGQRSATMPAQLTPGSRNPFNTAATSNAAAMARNAAAAPNGVSRHVSQESVDIGGYQNGRHSPDAFASLSARFVR